MDVSFNEEPQFVHRQAAPQRASGLTRLAISLGLATDETGASRALLVIAGMIICLSLVVYWMARPHGTPLSEQQLQRDLIRMKSPPHL